MKYRKDKYGNELSQLGYGCMRFTSKGGKIDYEKAEREIMRAIEKGVNYYDTAYAYPSGVDIPGNFHHWNLMYIEGKKNPVRFEFARNVGLHGKPGFASQCIGCGKCETHCPQHIQIREMLKKADKELRPLPYRIAMPIVRKIMSR